MQALYINYMLPSYLDVLISFLKKGGGGGIYNVATYTSKQILLSYNNIYEIVTLQNRTHMDIHISLMLINNRAMHLTYILLWILHTYHQHRFQRNTHMHYMSTSSVELKHSFLNLYLTLRKNTTFFLQKRIFWSS